VTDWRSLPEFEGIDLEDTRVTSWAYEPGAARVTLALEARVLPGHPAFEPPAEGEAAAAQPARLVFEGVTQVTGLPLPPPREWLERLFAAARGEAPAPVDTLGTLRRMPDGAFWLDATFGPVRVACASATLVVSVPADEADAADVRPAA